MSYEAQHFLLAATFTVIVSACRNQPQASSAFLESMAIGAYGSELIYEAKVRAAFPAEMAREEERCRKALEVSKDYPPHLRPGLRANRGPSTPQFLEVGVRYHYSDAQVVALGNEIAGTIGSRVLGFRRAQLDNDMDLINDHLKANEIGTRRRDISARLRGIGDVVGLWFASSLESPWQFAREQPGYSALGLLAARSALIGVSRCAGIVIRIRVGVVYNSKTPWDVIPDEIMPWIVADAQRHEKVLEVRRIDPPVGFVEREEPWFGDDD